MQQLGRFRFEFVVKQFEFIRLIGFNYANGVSGKNAILIVDFTNQLKAEGKHFKEALIIAGKGRMRPIPNDNSFNGCWYVSHCNGNRNSRRMEKRTCLGNHWVYYLVDTMKKNKS